MSEVEQGKGVFPGLLQLPDRYSIWAPAYVAQELKSAAEHWREPPPIAAAALQVEWASFFASVQPDHRAGERIFETGGVATDDSWREFATGVLAWMRAGSPHRRVILEDSLIRWPARSRAHPTHHCGDVVYWSAGPDSSISQLLGFFTEHSAYPGIGVLTDGTGVDRFDQGADVPRSAITSAVLGAAGLLVRAFDGESYLVAASSPSSGDCA